MPTTLPTTDRQDLARLVGRVRSGCRLVGWAVETMNEGPGQPEEPQRRMELYEGLSFVLELMAKTLGETQETLNEVNPGR